jgi:carbamoyltransferase
MLIVGLSGGFDSTYRLEFDLSYDFLHDASAVLLDDGRMVAAVELERLNRIKHTNRSPAPAVRACLDAYGAGIQDVGCFAFYATESACNEVLNSYHVRKNVGRQRLDIRTRLSQRLGEEFGCEIDPAKLHFADHHMCHALGAYVHSGFDRCLAVTIDGAGEGNSGLVLRARSGEFETLRSIPETDSLGYFYREVIRYLGYDMFEEYKVMGLAPYGDPSRFRDLFKNLYELKPDGGFQVSLMKIPILHTVLAPRQDDEPFETIHKDIAASLQEALETIVMHMLRHFRESTGETSLCVSGGVAHNSSMNGKILRSGLFDRVFVHPASHDAGGALGAAFHAHKTHRPQVAPAVLTNLFMGRGIGGDSTIKDTLSAWSPLVRVERLSDPCAATAKLLAEDAVIGWVQDRAEFGPRALGNRSILADPRPAENMSRINRMIKKRESYRPFAPSVLEEHARDYFEFPAGVDRLPYMVFVVPVREDKRQLLGAVTHIDGSARVQTVSREDNERYWQLIRAFGDLTGVPVLLNTSFNNNAEPIVDTLDEAVTCYLTTGLDYLIAGDYLVTRAPDSADRILDMAVSLPPTVAIRQVDHAVSPAARERHIEIFVRTDKGRRRRLSDASAGVLAQVAAPTPLRSLLNGATPSSTRDAVLSELRELWAQRLVTIAPVESRA